MAYYVQLRAFCLGHFDGAGKSAVVEMVLLKLQCCGRTGHFVEKKPLFLKTV